jgi:hypothetical protein
MVTQPQAPNRSIGRKQYAGSLPGLDVIQDSTVQYRYIFLRRWVRFTHGSHKIRTIDRGGDAEARSVLRSARHERCNAAAVQPRLRVQTPGLPLHANLGCDSELRVPECFGTVEE